MGFLADNAWFVGVLFEVCAACLNNLGLNLQKLTHVKLNERAVRRLLDEHASDLPLTPLPTSPHKEPGTPASVGRRIGGAPAMAPPTLGDTGEDEDAVSVVDSDSPEADEARRREERQREESSQQWKPKPWVTAAADRLLLSSSATAESYVKQPLWLLGFFFQVIGALCDFAALAFAAQSLIAPLGALTLVVNIYLAPFFSGERVSRRDVQSTALIIAGAVVAVAFASHDDEQRTPTEQFAFFTTVRFLIYATFITTTVVFLGSTVRFIDRIRASMAHARVPAVLEAREELKSVLRFLYGAMAGICGAQSILFAKSASTLVRFGFPEMFAHYEFYLIAGGLGLTLYLQIKYLNEALERFDALVIVPIFSSFWVTGGVVGGLVVYEESRHYDVLQSLLFGLGVAIIVAGVYSLSVRRRSSRNERTNSRLNLHRQSLAEGLEAGAAHGVASDPDSDAEPDVRDMATSPLAVEERALAPRKSSSSDADTGDGPQSFAV